MVVLAVLAGGYNTSTARPYWRRPQNSSTIRVMLFGFFNLCVLAGTGQARRVLPPARDHPPRGKQ